MGLCCLLMCFVCDRTPIDRDFPGHYSSDEEWHGYINNNDRVLLKVWWFLLSYQLTMLVHVMMLLLLFDFE